MLRLAREFPERVEEVGRHAGFDYALMHSRYGHWLAYCRFPDAHPFVTPDGEDPDCHGGVTWKEVDDIGHGFWKGYDYNHAWDLPDPALVARLSDADLVVERMRHIMVPKNPSATAWTLGEVRAEVEAVCEQARAAMTAAGPATVAEMLARAVLNGDLSAADALVDWWLENKRGGP